MGTWDYKERQELAAGGQLESVSLQLQLKWVSAWLWACACIYIWHKGLLWNPTPTRQGPRGLLRGGSRPWKGRFRTEACRASAALRASSTMARPGTIQGRDYLPSRRADRSVICPGVVTGLQQLQARRS